jgi:hypothetical protein
MNRIIYPTPEGGVAVIIPTGELPIEEVAAKDVPEGVPYEIVSTEQIPSDRYFRNAWVKGNGAVRIDMPKAKEIGHTIRRQKREQEFAPYDEIIAKQIPGSDARKAEAERQKIRDKYAAVQATIDAATTPEQIKAALEVTP